MSVERLNIWFGMDFNCTTMSAQKIKLKLSKASCVYLELCAVAEGDSEVGTSWIPDGTSKTVGTGRVCAAITIRDESIERVHARRPGSKTSDEYRRLPAENVLAGVDRYSSAVGGELVAKSLCVDAAVSINCQ